MKKCPNCGATDSLYSVEVMTVEYPVTVTAEGIDYTGEESLDFDETAEPTGRIHCRGCDWEGEQGALR